MWEKLAFDTIKQIISLAMGLGTILCITLIFKDASADFKKFILTALKSEFKTKTGVINLIGMFLIFWLLFIPSIRYEINGNTKAYVFGVFFAISLLISAATDIINKKK